MSQQKKAPGRPGRPAAPVHPTHRVWALICAVPKETTIVRQELEAEGIKRLKLQLLKRNRNEPIQRKDEMILVKYFKQYPQLGVRTIEDLYSTEEKESLANRFGASKSNV